MVNISAKKSNTIRNPSYESCEDLNIEFNDVDYDEEFEKGGLLFPSYKLYCVLADINERLSLFYTKIGEESDYGLIPDSLTRQNSCNFENTCNQIKYCISIFKEIQKNDPRVSEFLHNNCLSGEFHLLFEKLYFAFIEAMHSGDNFDNEIQKMQNNKIKEIVKDLAYLGIDPFTPHKI